jgi:hypothetical protein
MPMIPMTTSSSMIENARALRDMAGTIISQDAGRLGRLHREQNAGAKIAETAKTAEKTNTRFSFCLLFSAISALFAIFA